MKLSEPQLRLLKQARTNPPWVFGARRRTANVLRDRGLVTLTHNPPSHAARVHLTEAGRRALENSK